MNLLKAFADWMATNGYGVFGTSLFIGGVPQDAPDACYWITSGGGAPIVKNITGGKQKNYIITVNYRNTNGQTLIDNLQNLEELVNQNTCITLEDHTILEAEATQLFTDQDIDAEDREVGVLQVTLTVYQAES